MSTPTGQVPPAESTSQGAPTTDAIAAALANRETLMRSLEERRAQVFDLLRAQKQEALDSLQRTRDMLDRARPLPLPPTAPAPPPALSPIPTAEDGRERLRRRLGEALAILSCQPTAERDAEQDRRHQAVAAVADAIGDLIAEEITKRFADR